MARPKEFDEAKVLKKAMILFWQQGYESTSIQDLVNHMEIHRRSIYDTFGDKQTLFIKVLDLYEEMTVRNLKFQANKMDSTRLALRKLFELTVFNKGDLPHGCLMVNTAVELTLSNSEIAEKTKQSFAKMEAFIYELLVIGQKSGELSQEFELESLAQFIHNSFIGIRVLAKTTDDKQKLENVIQTTLSVLD
jgi:TetR/AcrR family transcriptional regulator, transcriptional repressor for nem operon